PEAEVDEPAGGDPGDARGPLAELEADLRRRYERAAGDVPSQRAHAAARARQLQQQRVGAPAEPDRAEALVSPNRRADERPESVTEVPVAYCWVPTAVPPVLEHEPFGALIVPRPRTVSVNVALFEETVVNVAPTVLAAFMVRVQVEPVPEHAPVQPVKVAPLS